MLARLLQGRVPCPAAETLPHTFWVFPILVEDPTDVIAHLRREGFDATQGSSMFVVPPPLDRPHLRALAADEVLSHLVYLPSSAQMPDAAIRRMAEGVL